MTSNAAVNDWILEHARLLDPVLGELGTTVWVRGGRIHQIDPDPQSVPADCLRVDGGGRLLTPGLIDVHVHATGQWLYETGPDALRAGLAALPAQGVTTVLPTLYRVFTRDHLNLLGELSAVLDEEVGSLAPGFHYEGPFLKLAGAAGFTEAADPELMDELIDAAGGKVASVSVSPDTENILPVIERLVQRGIAVYITHTAASVEETEAAISAGARHATHFYDVFPAPPVRDPGVRPVGCVEAVLADPRMTVDFVCDGVHVHPMAIRAAVAAKGPQGVIAITDANIGAGLAEGLYETPWGFPVRIEKGRAARIHDPGAKRHGALAGSALTMPEAIANLRRWLDLPEHQIWGMGSAYPAAMMGWSHKGRIQPGADADLVLWEETEDGIPRALRVWSVGRPVYAASI